MLFTGLKDVLRTFDEHGWKGSFTRGLWEIGNGGYDCWFVLKYKGLPVAQCIAGELESNFSCVSDDEKEKMFSKILEVYDHLKVRKVEDSFLENLAQEGLIQETVNNWLDNLLESVGKSSVDDLTCAEILEEIEDVKGSIENEKITLGFPGSFAEENIESLSAYLEELNALCDKAREKDGFLEDKIAQAESVKKPVIDRDMTEKGAIDKESR